MFLNTTGPQITAVTYHNSGQNVFATVPTGPQSNVTQIDIAFTDATIRPAQPTPFYGTYMPQQSNSKNSALNQVLADITSNYQLVGKNGGIIPISSAIYTDTTGSALPGPGTGFVTLTFAQPLPNDTYTLTVLDTITDDAGNALDGGNLLPVISRSGAVAIDT